MREREQERYGKYRIRLAREVNRNYLEQIFEFLEKGIPESWTNLDMSKIEHETEDTRNVENEDLTGTSPETNPSLNDPDEKQHHPDLPESEEVQKAVRAVLTATCSAREPSCLDLHIIQRCLNLPITVKAGTRKIIRDRKLNDLTLFAFETPYYFKYIAERLRICLSDYYEIAVSHQEPEAWPVELCKICNKLFLKKKANQNCCSRPCTNAYDYKKRKEESNGEYARKKSKKSYDSAGAKLKRKRAAKKKTQKTKD